MKKITLLLVFLSFLGFQAMAQTTVTGTVTGADDGSPLPGVSVLVKGTQKGGITDIDGKYSVVMPAGSNVLVFSFIGMKTVEKNVGSATTLDVAMQSGDVSLDDVVVTALGITREKKTLSYASQNVSGNDLNSTNRVNIKTAIAGKVAGVQIRGQAGSKLGDAGKIRLRGVVSLTEDSDPLYIIDGIPSDDPGTVDMEEIASINVLKGPNATALYGQRAEFGVIVITTKTASNGISVEVNHSTTFDKVAYLPNYQNMYAQGYDGEATLGVFDYAAGAYPFGAGPYAYPESWSVFNGKNYYVGQNSFADESWGPKINGQDYVPWYAWFEDSPYFGQTEKLQAYPDNVKDFYDTGVAMKTSVAVSGGGKNYKARLSYGNQNQKGLIPFSTLKKHLFGVKLDFDLNDKISFGTNVRYTADKIEGDFDDDYGNQSSGSFNAWFGRNLDANKMRELIDLKTPDGYHATWNWWGADLYTGGIYGFWKGEDLKKPAFWYNPYYWAREYSNVRKNDRLIADIHASYKITENIEWTATASMTNHSHARETILPYSLALSAAPNAYNTWMNGMKRYNYNSKEVNFSTLLKYKKNFGDFDVSAFVGGNIRKNSYRRISTEMDFEDKSDGFIMPDVFDFSNARKTPTTGKFDRYKEVRSMFGNVSFGYKNMLYFDMSGRNDVSSALPADNNGYFYPSFGTSFIFSELLESSVLSFGKFRAGWAQVGNDVAAHLLNPTYPIYSKPYTFTDGDVNALMSTNTQLVDPNIKPSLNTSMEVGFDVKFFFNRVGLSLTYYNEKRKDEIIPVSISKATGYSTYLTNGGTATRSGFEVSLNLVPVKMKNFVWDLTFNIAANKTIVNTLPSGLEQMTAPNSSRNAFGFVDVVHKPNEEWGQLYGAGFKMDNGKYVLNDDGTFVAQQGSYLGSVLPDFTGGILNQFSIYKNLLVTVNIDFQKGGNFFSLSEFWGGYSGLLAETAATNDKGNNVRDAVADGGGVHVQGVSESGAAIDTYVEAHDYFTQFYSNKLAEPFVHDASYIKLRDISISYVLPRSLLTKTFISSASIGFVGRNLWLISVSEDNVHGWDPSEMAETFGENAQLPGTRSYGFNVKLTF